MNYILDTHAIVWYLEGSPQLKSSTLSILGSSEASLIIPTIVLAEIWHLHSRGRIRTDVQAVRARLLIGDKLDR